MTEKEFPLIKGQRGLASGAQLRKAGWTPAAIRHLANTHGQRVAWQVYAPSRAALSPDDWLVAGWLWAGPSSVLTGARALARHGVEVGREGGVRYLVSEHCRNRVGPRGAVTVRTRQLPSGMLRQDIRIAPLERALVDAAVFRDLPHRELRALTIQALQEGRTTADRLEDEAEAARSNGLAPIRSGILAFRSGAWSLPEAQLQVVVAAHPELPAMLTNPRLSTPEGVLIGYPDGYFADAGVAVQVHSRAYHDGQDASGTDRWTATVEHDNDYQRHGIVVVPVTPHTLETDAAAFVAGLAEVVRAHLGRPPLDILVS